MINQNISDPVGLSVARILYTNGSPTRVRDESDAFFFCAATSDYDAIAPNVLGLSRPRTHIPMDSP